MSTDLTPFIFDDQPIRSVVGPDGLPLFVLADVCAALGIANHRNVAARLDGDDVRSVDVIDSMGRTQQMHAVTEAGVIDVTLDSRKPEARRFRRWLTHEVVPQIVQTGGYGTAPALTGPALLAAAVIEAQAMLTAQSEALAVMAPKAEYVDRYVADGDLLKFRTVAANLKIKESELREILLERGWIYVETMTRWSESKQCKETVRRYSASSEKKAYFTPRPNHEAPRFKGEAMHTLKVTPIGAHAIERLVNRSSIQPDLTLLPASA